MPRSDESNKRLFVSLQIIPGGIMSEEISMNEAVRRAISTVKELLANDQIRNVALEEIEKESSASRDWLITVGYDTPRAVQKRLSPMSALLLNGPEPETERKYKIMRINPDGQFVSMKIRNA
jgi:hypothetical protein